MMERGNEATLHRNMKNCQVFCLWHTSEKNILAGIRNRRTRFQTGFQFLLFFLGIHALVSVVSVILTDMLLLERTSHLCFRAQITSFFTA